MFRNKSLFLKNGFKKYLSFALILSQAKQQNVYDGKRQLSPVHGVRDGGDWWGLWQTRECMPIARGQSVTA